MESGGKGRWKTTGKGRISNAIQAQVRRQKREDKECGSSAVKSAGKGATVCAPKTALTNSPHLIDGASSLSESMESGL